MGLDYLWLPKTLTQNSAHWYSWQTWLISMHCSQKTFHFLSVSNGPTSILLDIVITLRKSHETILVVYFWKITNTCERCFWDVSETSRKRHLFCEICLRRLKTSHKRLLFEMFLRRLKDVKKRHLFWDVFKTS